MKKNQQALLEDHFRSILIGLGEDPDREGLKNTPKRVIKHLQDFLSPPRFKFTTFDAENNDEMVVLLNVPFTSCCEHHILNFKGHAHIGYLPNKRIVGLSKLARAVEWYSRRLQNQERLTAQVAELLWNKLSPLGVGIVIEAEHSCMSQRGACKPGAVTVTSKMLGRFKDNEATRTEFLNLINANRKSR